MDIKKIFLKIKKFRPNIPFKSSNNLIILLAITLIILISVFGFLFQKLNKKNELDVLTEKYKSAKTQEEKDSARRELNQLLTRAYARTPKDRQPAVDRIKAFAGNNAQIEYLYGFPSIYNKEIIEEYYRAGFDSYIINVNTNDVIKTTEMIHKAGDPQKQYDWTPKYSRLQLEKMARAFIAKYEPGVDLSRLTPNYAYHNNRSIFRWEDTSRQLEDPNKSYPFIEVGYTTGGDLLVYANYLDF